MCGTTKATEDDDQAAKIYIEFVCQPGSSKYIADTLSRASPLNSCTEGLQ